MAVWIYHSNTCQNPCEYVTISDLDLLLRPLVQIDGLDLGDVDPQVSMDAGTADADEDAQIPGCPSGT